jgi:hypothetical protein
MAGQSRANRVDRVLERAARRSGDPEAWYRLFQVRRKHRMMPEAMEALQQAVALHPAAPKKWLKRLGRTGEQLGRIDVAREAYGQFAERWPGPKRIAPRLLNHSPREFPVRHRTGVNIAGNIAEIREAALGRTLVADRSQTIWVYWAQGIESAPSVVRLCHEALLRYGGDRVVTLTDADLAGFVSLPPDIGELLEGQRIAFRADLVRLELLSRYGGTWVDATILVNAGFADELADLARPTGFFAYDKDRTTIANWCMVASPNHYMVNLQLEAMYAHWRTFGELLDYFTFHHVFEALLLVDRQFAEQWKATPHRPRGGSLRLWAKRDTLVDEAGLRELLDASHLHKLNYKVKSVVPGSVLDRLIAMAP